MPTISFNNNLSMVRIWETLTIESLGSPERSLSRSTFPGAMPNLRFEVMTATTTVLIRLELNRSS